MNRFTTLAAACVLALAGCASFTRAPSSDSQPSTSITVGSTLEASAGLATQKPTASAPAGNVAAWNKANGSWIATLQGDVTSVATDQHDASSLPTDCMQLDSDWQYAHAIPPIPSAAAQKTWSAALDALHTGWWDCNGGFSDNKPSEVSNAVAAVQAAGALLIEVKSSIAAVKSSIAAAKP